MPTRCARPSRAIDGARVIFAADSTFLAHIGGKIRIDPKIEIKTRQDLSTVYTPGVARVSMAIAADPAKAFQLTIKRNTVAVVTDGTAVLGFGDIGPLGALPVMEGKAMLFKQFADIDAFPICLDTKNVDEIVETVVRIAPVFGGINLEDISAPRCFEVEERLIEALDIPVMHDDQHGTAVVILAALINAARVVGKPLEDLAGRRFGKRRGRNRDDQDAAGRGRARRDSGRPRGALNRTDRYENPHWRWLAEHCNRENRRGSLREVLEGVDVFIGVSAPGILQPEDIARMARDPIVFAMANPTPEIMPDVAAPVAAVIATGRSDFPNQVNNLLAFPGIFRGALDVRARRITERMKLAAALRDSRDRHRRRAERRVRHSQRLRRARGQRRRQGGRRRGCRGGCRTAHAGEARRRRRHRPRLVASARSSVRIRHESSDALRNEKTIASSVAPKASGNTAISAQTTM